MNETAYPLPDGAIWKHFAGHGKPAHFYHANGFPLGVYEHLLTRLSQQFRLSALALRPTWPGIGDPPKRRDWKIYADDLVSFIQHECETPIIAIAHSMGAACTVLAAEQRPELFEALVLIEIAMLPRVSAGLVRWIPKQVMNFVEPMKSTLAKSDRWPTRESYLDDCRSHPAYKRFNAEALEALRQFGVLETPEGHFRLAFPKQWEAHNYTQPPNLMGSLARLKVPCVAIRGKPSLFFSENMWQQWQRICPDTVFVQDADHGHLLPLENAGRCVELIQTGLAELKIDA